MALTFSHIRRYCGPTLPPRYHPAFFMQTMDLSLNTSTLIAIGMSVGILVSGMLTLIVMPVLYDLFTARSAPPHREDSRT